MVAIEAIGIATKALLRRAARSVGLEIRRAGPCPAESYDLVQRIRERRIACVLDVGANVGQFAQSLRSDGYAGQIYSFEPLGAAFADLQQAADLDGSWFPLKVALGAAKEQRELRIAANSVSSSLLEICPRAVEAEPAARVVGCESVQVETLDSLMPTLAEFSAPTLLKLDVQGFERQVIAGASQTMQWIDAVVIECSLCPIYEGEWLFGDVVRHFLSTGFRLEHVSPVFVDGRTGEVLQVDSHFWRIR